MVQKSNTPKKETKIPMHVYVGYLLILTLVFTGVSFAKFATSGDAADTAKVAAFSVTASVGDDNSKTVDFNDAAQKFGTSKTVEYDINVTNKENGRIAEVAVGYSIVVSFDSEDIVPEALSFSIDGVPLTPVKDGTLYVCTFEGAAPMPAGTETSVTHKLSVTVNSENILHDYSNIPISISALFEQLD